MCRVVIRPVLLRPPVFGLGTSSDFSGVDRVSSAKSATLEPRRPGVVGLYLRIAMVVSFLVSAQPAGAEKMSMRSPSATVTMARLVSGRLPEAGAGPPLLALAG